MEILLVFVLIIAVPPGTLKAKEIVLGANPVNPMLVRDFNFIPTDIGKPKSSF